MPDPNSGAHDIVSHPFTNTLIGSALMGIGTAFAYIVKMGSRITRLEEQHLSVKDDLDEIKRGVRRIENHIFGVRD